MASFGDKAQMSTQVKGISRPMTVLVVSPDEQGREALAGLLRSTAGSELQVDVASGVADSLRLFHKNHPDLMLISTAQLSGIGAEITSYVRSSEGNRHTGLIFVDGPADDDAAQSVACLEMGADDFVRRGTTAAELMARIRAVLRLKEMTDQLRSANHKLRQLSLTDELTGLANMRQFNLKFADLLRACRKGKSGLGVLMLDLDHFKSVNDTTNHLIGSFVISETGKLVRELGLFGGQDVEARYGGDEFIIACAATNLACLQAKAEKVRRAIASATFERDGHCVRVTSSIGAAFVERGFRGRAEDVIKAADTMLYKSKGDGRDRVSGISLKYQLDLVTDSGHRLARRGLPELVEALDEAEAMPKRVLKG